MVILQKLDASIPSRILEEGYGPGAWHGSNLKAALTDVSSELALWRPIPGSHNIAEIALHHAYYVRNVRGQLSGKSPESFVLQGDDWFTIPDQTGLTWTEIQAVLEEEQQRLVTLVADISNDRMQSPLAEAERFDLVLGITCHAIYHAGQVQLIKRLHAV